MSFKKIKNTTIKICQTTNTTILSGLCLLEFILSYYIIKYSYHYINYFSPIFLRNYNDTILIINNYTTYNYTIKTTKIWGEIFLNTAGYGIILLFLILWLFIAIAGITSLIYRIFKYASNARVEKEEKKTI